MAMMPAQRRPGRQPRRHVDRDHLDLDVALRSTKAGASTPATPPPSTSIPGRTSTLNEGRGVNPGDTPGATLHRPGRLERSTKAGASTPATREVVIGADGHDARSTKAGASTPATHQEPVLERVGAGRSTKAGASTPATREVVIGADGHDARSTKAGASTPATPAQGAKADLAISTRSTKAGASTPATPSWWYLATNSQPFAQRRPGRQPRRHPSRESVEGVPRPAQRRPGRQPRRHQCGVPGRHGGIDRSTKAGASTPATRARFE